MRASLIAFVIGFVASLPAFSAMDHNGEAPRPAAEHAADHAAATAVGTADAPIETTVDAVPNEELALERVRGYVGEWQELERLDFNASEDALRSQIHLIHQPDLHQMWLNNAKEPTIPENTRRMSSWLIETLGEKQRHEGDMPDFAERVGALFDGSAAETARRVQEFTGGPSSQPPPEAELSPEQLAESRQIVMDWLEHNDRHLRFGLRRELPAAFERSVLIAGLNMSDRLEHEEALHPSDPAPAFAKKLILRLAELYTATSYVSSYVDDARELLAPLSQKVETALREAKSLESAATALKAIDLEHMKELFRRLGTPIARTKGDVVLNIAARQVPVAMNDAGTIKEFSDLHGFWWVLSHDNAQSRAQEDPPEERKSERITLAEELEKTAQLISGQSTLPPAQIRVFDATARLHVAEQRLLSPQETPLASNVIAEMNSVIQSPISLFESSRRVEEIVERAIRDWAARARRRAFRVVSPSGEAPSEPAVKAPEAEDHGLENLDTTDEGLLSTAKNGNEIGTAMLGHGIWRQMREAILGRKYEFAFKVQHGAIVFHEHPQLEPRRFSKDQAEAGREALRLWIKYTPKFAAEHPEIYRAAQSAIEDTIRMIDATTGPGQIEPMEAYLYSLMREADDLPDLRARARSLADEITDRGSTRFD